MSSKIKKVFLLLLIVILMALLVWKHICYQINWVESQNNETHRTKHGDTVKQVTIFNLKDLSRFEWDKMNMLKPYIISHKESSKAIQKEAVDNKPEYVLIPNVKFHVLTDEYFENKQKDNSNVSILVRKYWVYDGTEDHNWIAPSTCMIATEKVSEIKALRENLVRKSPESLRLLPNTIVSEQVLCKWKSEGYEPKYEYYEECPTGLTYKELK